MPPTAPRLVRGRPFWAVGAGVAGLLLLVAVLGCGEPAELPDAEVVDGEAPAEPAAPAEPREPEPAEEPDTSAEVVLGDGVARHRAGDLGIGAPDCAKMRGNLLGAFLQFPSDERPGTSQVGPGPVLVEVTGCVNLSGGRLDYAWYHEDNPAPTLVGDTDAGAGTGWVAFRFEEVLWSPGTWTLRLLAEGEVLDEAGIVVG